MTADIFNTTELDANQVIKKVYDDNTQTLRTIAQVSFPGSLDVNISASQDSIAIGKGNDLVDVSTVGPAKALKVDVISTVGGAGGVAISDQQPFTSGVTSTNPISGTFNDSIPSVSTGAVGVVRLTANRALHSNLRDNTGAALGITGNPLIVQDISGGGGGGGNGAALVDNSAFTIASTSTATIAGIFNDSAAAITSGAAGAIRSTANRAIHTNLRNASGIEIGTSSSPISVSVVGGASGGTAQADRSTFTDGSGQLTPIGGVLNDTGTDPSEDQAAAVRITAKRGLHVNLRGADGLEFGTISKPLVTSGAAPAQQATRLDEASATVTYVGKAAVGTSNAAASWQISRITASGTVTTIEFADGNDSFDNVWNNRASLSYS